ncbi:MFS transporter [Enorma phocaeensis]|uniref:MFS transporter n=1 Tax=Enorma phocaeensis TaxID=1871019 RepID=A0ABT7VAB4_9ACTN|nr:hypothetical protein [Enorma phocaeensis]MDM8275445.1 hypothetical protein [Enorma phocaeensis]
MPAGLLPIIYLAFVALGLPDSAIGSAWPAMAPSLGASLSWVGAVTMIISAGTIVSSLMSVRVVERFGTGRVTAASVLLCFFCYCAIEGTCGNWAASYSSLAAGVPTQTAASWASMFYIGITVGRALSGFLSLKCSDSQMIRLGQVLIAAGVLTMISPWGHDVLAPALVLIGLGCAPIYPSIIHATPARFGDDVALELAGMQMAIAYVGFLVCSPLSGVLAQYILIDLYPYYLGVFLVVMVIAAEKVNRVQKIRAAHRA